MNTNTQKLNLADFAGLFRSEPKDLADQELLSLDFILHRAWAIKRAGDEALGGGGRWELAELFELHDAVRSEMSGRNFKHTIDDELEKRSQALARGETDDWPEDSLGAMDFSKGIRQAFGSYGGKRFLAHKIASYIPHHRTYVETFAGGGAVFFAKDHSPKEVLNDRDPEIAFMYRFIRDHSAEDRQALAKRDWVLSKEVHERLKKTKPETDRDRFYKNYYLTRSSYGKQRGGPFNPGNAGTRIDFPANVERAQTRLKSVTLHNKDYRDVLKEHDSPDTFFYMDPPYPGKFNLFDFGFKEEDFLKAIKRLKAKWIVSYPSENADKLKSYNVYTVKRRNQMKGPGGNQEWVTEIMASNFPLKPLNLYIEKDWGLEPAAQEERAPETREGGKPVGEQGGGV